MPCRSEQNRAVAQRKLPLAGERGCLAERRRSVRWTLMVVSLLLTAGCAVGSSDGSKSPAASAPTDAQEGGEWVRLPDGTLSPREGSSAAYVGGEVLIVGGYSGPPCPPGADCPMPPEAVERDGAAYDLDTGTWRSITSAPRPVPPWASTAAVGDRLYVLAGDSLLAWDSGEDSWEEVSTPEDPSWSYLVVDGTRLVLASGSDETGVRPDHVYDTSTGAWSILPQDPLKPSWGRALISTSHGLVLTAKSIRPDGGPADPALVLAAVLPPAGDAWRPLPVMDQLGGRWTWTGQRLVDPTLGGADGGQVNNYGRVIPFGGRLDPATGDWSPLPDAPSEGSGGWSVDALDGPRIAAGGWLYDDSNGSWALLPRPHGAPADPGPSVWADDVLVVYGGADWDPPDAHGQLDPESVWSTSAWAYRVL